MKLSRSLIAFIILGVSACGQKGPLYMPDLEKLSNQVSENKAGISQKEQQEEQQKTQQDEADSEPSGSQ